MIGSYSNKHHTPASVITVVCDRGRGIEFLSFPGHKNEQQITRVCTRKFCPGRLKQTTLNRYRWVIE